MKKSSQFPFENQQWQEEYDGQEML